MVRTALAFPAAPGDYRRKHNLLNLELSDDDTEEEDLHSTSASEQGQGAASPKELSSDAEESEQGREAASPMDGSSDAEESDWTSGAAAAPAAHFGSPSPMSPFLPMKVLRDISPPPGLERHVACIPAPPGFEHLPWHPKPVALEYGMPVYVPGHHFEQRIGAEPPAVQASPTDPAAKSEPFARCAAPTKFELTAFHKDLAEIVKALVFTDNSGAAVRRVREWKAPVPRECQAQEYADLLTRAAEEPRGLARRRCFAFAAGLCSGKTGNAFARKECIAGVDRFFREVYEDLCLEVPRLPAIVARELVPTLALKLPKKELRSVLPGFLWGSLTCETSCHLP